MITLKNMVENSDNAPKQCEKRWIFSSSYLVHDYILSGNKVAFDLEVSPKGWVLWLLGRNRLSSKYVGQLVTSRRDQITVDDRGRFIVEKWPLDASLDEIKENLCAWMSWIVQEDANMNNEAPIN